MGTNTKDHRKGRKIWRFGEDLARHNATPATGRQAASIVRRIRSASLHRYRYSPLRFHKKGFSCPDPLSSHSILRDSRMIRTLIPKTVSKSTTRSFFTPSSTSAIHHQAFFLLTSRSRRGYATEARQYFSGTITPFADFWH